MGNWLKEKVVDPVVKYNPITISTDIVTGGKFSETLGVDSVYADVEDVWYTLSGEEAADAAKAAAAILESSTASSIEKLEAQNLILEQMYQPFYEKSTEALSTLERMVSGDYQFEPSELYTVQKEQGERAIKRGQAARGMLRSTGTESKLANFGIDLLNEEAERQYGGVLSQIQLGAGAADAISQASQSMSGNVGSLYSSLGQNVFNLSQMTGQAKQSAYQTLGNTLQNIGMYSMMTDK